MKKVLSVLFSLVLVIGIAFTFGGCGEEEDIEVRGKFYSLEQAYENDWLNEDDLKSIACIYYDYYFQYEENPYSGMFASTEELTKETEAEVKQAFLKQVAYSPSNDRERVHITKYYGTFNGNIVINGYCEDVIIDYDYEETADIGGVLFKEFWSGKCLVYHIKKADEKIEPVEVRGQLYSLPEAYEKGWLNQADLKSIAYGFYDYFWWFEENPYSDMFTSTEELTKGIRKELRQAYLEQIVEIADGDRTSVEITYYYGTYNSNVVVYITSPYLKHYDYVSSTKNIGGIIFEEYWDGAIFVYHMDQAN